MPRAGMLRRRCVPSERPRRAGYGSVARPELADYFLRHKIRASRVTRDQLAGDTIDLAHRREQTSVARDSAHRECVLVVNLADQQPFARRTYFARREHVGDRLQPPRAYMRNIYIVGGAQAQRPKNFLATVSVERDARDFF